MKRKFNSATESDCKRLLLIKAAGMEEEASECKIITELCFSYEIAVHCIEAKDNCDLGEKIFEVRQQFDFIYLSAHGNSEIFGSEDECINVPWDQFSSWLCESGVLKEDSILFHSCCRGGLDQVAFSLFYTCPQISYVIGPREKLCALDMVIAFHLLLYSREYRYYDAVIACKRIESGASLRFKCFDRMEIESMPAYHHYTKRQWTVEELENADEPPTAVTKHSDDDVTITIQQIKN